MHREVWLPGQSDANTGYEPKEFDKITSVNDDTMLINDPNHNFSDFSKTTNENRTDVKGKSTEQYQELFSSDSHEILL